ncbi:MAG: DUF1002 domain-containing protein [Oscillospiraceae bacterium]|jgi:uncharacterized protein YpuA (DUF1002 family)|nr:DUF1002 domain-containing protein [Oscillospiraceae bacterium]
MKKFISTFLAVCALAGLSAVRAIDAGEARAVIGANITADQKAAVYAAFGKEPGSVTELTVTNDEERKYLDGLVDASIIGTKSISSVYLEVLEEGKGLDVSVTNISWCTKEMYMNALVTAGIDNAKLIVTSPIAGISGTAALTGVYKAYEDMTGQPLDEIAKIAGTQELVVTADLADQIGSYDAVTIVNELKKVLAETVNMTDDELKAEIKRIAAENGISVTDGQVDQLLALCRSLEKLDPDQLKAKVESLQNTIKKLAAAQTTLQQIGQSIKGFFESVGKFFAKLFS